MTATRVVPFSVAQWAALAPTYGDLSYRQTPSFVAEMARLNKAAPEFVSLQDDAGVIGLVAVRVKSLPVLPFGVAYILHGPITMRNEPFSPARYAACLDALVRHYVKERKLSLRVVPPFAASRSPSEATAAFASEGFRKLEHKVNRTIILAVDRDLAQIRKGLEGRWRNMLTQAEKLTIDIVETTEADDFRIMEPMLHELEERKNFQSGHGVAFFERVQRLAAPFERLALHLGRYQDRVVSATLTSFAGDAAVLLLAATNEEGRRIRASYRMQWRIVEDAKRMGKRWYDLGGVDPIENPDGYRFKKRVNGVELAELGVFEYAPNVIASGVLTLAERVYRRSR